MRPSRALDHGRESIDALVTDHYLDMLLAQVERRGSTTGRAADGAGGPQTGATPEADVTDPEVAVRRAAAVLRASLLRAHPSFRFEERLAAQLAELSGTRAWPAVATVGRSGQVIPFPATLSPVDDPLLAAVLAGQLDPSDESAVDRANGVRSPARPLLVGGAITSAAISLVGVAWYAWRASRPGSAPMSRAARAAHARRIADLADLAAGMPGGPA